ncbi:hypothetical protein [Neptuniibacter sp. QD37_11]|uniref:hypothetical protein n=1 Tax=Neptuniibacter sp. QD37_11 TaxID=3398209 RepID=UPI0039F5B101
MIPASILKTVPDILDQIEEKLFQAAIDKKDSIGPVEVPKEISYKIQEVLVKNEYRVGMVNSSESDLTTLSITIPEVSRGGSPVR